MKNLTQGYTLANGVNIPMVGFGTFKIPAGKKTEDTVKEALDYGYRHLDCAMIYQNEEDVGNGIKASGVNREDIFLVSKVWNTDQGYESTKKAFNATLARLQTDYLDMYLIHWPKALNSETWRAMEELYEDGKIKAIGVCNFNKHHLEDLFKTCKIKPMVNQIELHPQLAQTELCAYCKENNIQVEAWASLMRGKVFDIPLLNELAVKYNKNTAQIALKWALQLGYVVIPKSVTPTRIASNADLFDFEISKEDMEQIATLDVGNRMGPDPDNFDF